VPLRVEGAEEELHEDAARLERQGAAIASERACLSDPDGRDIVGAAYAVEVNR